MRNAIMVEINLHHLRLVGPEGRKKWEVQQVVPKGLEKLVGRALGKETIGTLTYNTGCRQGEEAEAVVVRDAKLPELQAIIQAAREQDPVAQAERAYERAMTLDGPISRALAERRGRIGRLRAKAFLLAHDLRYQGAIANAHRILGSVESLAPQPILEWTVILDIWKRSKQLKDDDGPVKARRRAVSRFYDWLNRDKPESQHHADMVRVTTHDLIGYKECLIDRLNDPKDKGVRKSKTVEEQLYEVRGLFRYAFENKKFPEGHLNPGVGVSYKGKTDDRDKYLDFTPDEIPTILKQARSAPHPFVRWFHWLAAYTGGRVAEIAEAQTQDVEIRADGTVVFHIRLENRPPSQRLKTEFSPRPVPLHQAVLDEAFLSFVDWVKRTYHGGGDGPLFPMLKMYAGRLNDDASERSMEWLRSIGIGVNPDGSYDRRKANHSWRHTVKTRFRDTDAEGNHFIPREDVVDKLTGHANGSIGREYGHFPIPMLKRNIDRVPAWEIGSFDR